MQGVSGQQEQTECFRENAMEIDAKNPEKSQEVRALRNKVAALEAANAVLLERLRLSEGERFDHQYHFARKTQPGEFKAVI